MRLFLLPISTRRTLIYCERVQQQLAPGQQPPLSERVINRASETWAGWERAQRGWQKTLTVYGNKMLSRIPFEEWGLKSIPPASKKRLADMDGGHLRFECHYPAAFLASDRVPKVLRQIATERQAFHRRNLWNSILWMPITLPFTVVPIIPNIPFFYLVFRAYSHYRALYGGRLLEHALSRNLVSVNPSPQMDQTYTAGLLHSSRQLSREAKRPTEEETEQVRRVVDAQTQSGKEEVMVLQRWNGQLIAEEFHLPEMEVEIERAVEQVEKAIEKDQKELSEEKDEVMRSKAQIKGAGDSMVKREQ